MLSTTDIQRAVFEALATNPELGTIRDHLPTEQDLEATDSYPHTVMSDHTATGWDTDSDEGIDMIITIDTWSRYPGNQELKTMMDIIRDELNHADLVLQEIGMHCVLVEMTSEQVLSDPDGVTRHGIQEFRILAESLT